MPTQKEMEDDGCVVVAVLSAVIFSEVSSSMMMMIMTTTLRVTETKRGIRESREGGSQGRTREITNASRPSTADDS